MQVKVDGSQLHKLAQDALRITVVTRKQAVHAVKTASLAVEKRIKIEMPVDTGRARASWGHWTTSSIRNPAAGDLNPSDAIWKEADGGLTVTQGSNVVYIPFLNSGHSRQAPAGFIDMAQLHGQIALEKFLGLIDPLDPNLQWLQFA